MLSNFKKPFPFIFLACAIRKGCSVATCKILKGKCFKIHFQRKAVFKNLKSSRDKKLSRFAPSSGRKRHPVFVVFTIKIGSETLWEFRACTFGAK
jgi:hypothetical protein